ncbi:hypothetical protein JCGZ_22145 [Jatropha curcas]|uniref:ATPase AAA-type core domain-containing protein n=1 Tax=Jatropha curcas TaxID=180498 RepID=A0A067LBF1_JATCU|nr:hypothetical protein JCGZ_22145 [Jatropha curcas]
MASSSAETNLATAKTVLSTAASVAATVMLARSVAQDLLPREFHDYFFFNIRKFFNRFSSQITIVIDEFHGFGRNQMFKAAETYLGSKISPSTQRFKVSKSKKEKNFTFKMERNEEIIDVFQGVKFKWVFVCQQVQSKNYYHPSDQNSSLRSEIRSFELRRLLISTGNRSILVVEDIDCSLELQDRLAEASDEQSDHRSSPKKKVTLSGLLNFIDGLWSSCGDERIIVLTTNHKEKLDPALLRPGRMDVHVHMSYCTPCGFRLLASNYVGINDHFLFQEIEEFISTTQVTPAEVAEQLMRSDEPETVLVELIQFLKVKKKENDEEKAKESAVVVDREQEQTVENEDDDDENDN